MFDLQIVRSNAFDGRQDSLQDVILALIATRPLQRQDVQRFFHDTDQTAIPLGRLADFTAFASRLGDVETFLAEGSIGFEVCQRRRQILGDIIGARKR